MLPKDSLGKLVNAWREFAGEGASRDISSRRPQKMRTLARYKIAEGVYSLAVVRAVLLLLAVNINEADWTDTARHIAVLVKERCAADMAKIEIKTEQAIKLEGIAGIAEAEGVFVYLFIKVTRTGIARITRPGSSGPSSYYY